MLSAGFTAEEKTYNQEPVFLLPAKLWKLRIPSVRPRLQLAQWLTTAYQV
jgi:hypothetical protein